MRACRGTLLFRKSPLWSVGVAAAPLHPNYGNVPFQKVRDSTNKKDTTDKPKDGTMKPIGAILPAPMRPAVIDPTPVTVINKNHLVKSFRQAVCASTDLAMRPIKPMLIATGDAGTVVDSNVLRPTPPVSYGDKAPCEVSCRWSSKFYGQVTFGPRNFPYSSSRWLARRFRMKKHRILKRFRFRRYKLAAVANLPFAKMVRVGMLPELKSSKTKKGDAVDASLSSHLVNAAQSSTGSKVKGRRPRPKSKYQV